jgi:hypothetical protein
VLRQGRPCAFHARVRFNEAVENPAVAVVFENEQHQPLVATSTDWTGSPTGAFVVGDEVVFTVRFDLAFAMGRVFASPWVARGHSSGKLMDRRPEMASVVVTGDYASGGLVELPHDVELRAHDRVLSGRPA